MWIVLEPTEIMMAGLIGLWRKVQCIERGMKEKHGSLGGWTYDIEGACGELAAARALGLPFTGTVGTFRKVGDIGDLEIKTRSKPGYELLVRKDDHPDRKFILVRGVCPTYEVVGWMLGRDAMQDEWLKAHGGREPAYFVPDDKLKPIDELILELKYGRT